MAKVTLTRRVSIAADNGLSFGVHDAGETVDVSAEQAEQMLRDGWAVKVGTKPPAADPAAE